MTRSTRIESIDFWRGLALLIVFIDHLPDNPLANITPGNFGFSDAAEAFIFLSGMALVCAYWPKFGAGETRYVVHRCLRRALQIYGAQLAICAASVAIFGCFFLATRDPGLATEDGRDLLFSNPVMGTLGLLTLGFQLGYANILPLYIALLLMAPALLIALRHSIGLGMAISLSLYLAAQAGLGLPSWPWPGSWFFNPFAWQLMFVLGMCSAILMRRYEFPRSKLLLILAAGVVIGALVIETDGFGFAPGLSDNEGFFGVDKPLLGPGRIVHFLSLAYILVYFNFAGTSLKWRFAHELSRLGRHSLLIFSAGSMLCAVGQSILDLADWIDSDLIFDVASLLVVAVGIVLMILLARLVEAPRHLDLAAVKPDMRSRGLASLARIS